MRRIFSVVSLTLALIAPAAYAADSAGGISGASATFRIDTKTGVPGQVLKPGEYSIQVVDQLSDRMIVKIEGAGTKEHTLFLGVSRPSLATESSSGPLVWKSGPNGSPALKGFEFARGSAVEFVYPKAEAVALAKLNAAPVIAADPESEGRPAFKNLSQDDLQMVNLWMLSLTTASPKDKTPAILAQKYQGEAGASPLVAASTPAKSLASQPQQVATVEQPARPGAPNDTPTTRPARRQVVAKLPHTASPVALIAFAGMFFLLFGVVVRSIANRISQRNA